MKERLINYKDQEEDLFYCLECKKEFEIHTDIILCDECMLLFDTDELWKLHDNNKLDALDFNERKSIREKFRLK